MARAPALAAGALALAELALQRVGAPVASHVPGTSDARPVVESIGAAGDLATGAVAVLVVATAAGLGVSQRHRPLVAAALATATLSTVAALALPGAAAAGHVTVIAAALLVAGLAVAASPPWHGAGVAVAAAVVMAGQWALLGGPAGAAELSELALVAVPLLFAGAVLREHHPALAAWGIAGIAALLTAAALLTQPGHAALVALWSVGVTLALPTPLYVLAAGAAGLAVADWLSTSGRRHRAAGLVLLIVAGAQPALVHHNLTALVGLVLLALPAGRTGGLDA